MRKHGEKFSIKENGSRRSRERERKREEGARETRQEVKFVNLSDKQLYCSSKRISNVALHVVITLVPSFSLSLESLGNLEL